MSIIYNNDDKIITTNEMPIKIIIVEFVIEKSKLLTKKGIKGNI